MKSNTAFRIISVLASVSFAAMPVIGQEESVSLDLANQLEEAIFLQEGKADLGEAVAAYEEILAETELVSSLAAEAKYRLAICYMDQGKKEVALATLAQLVASYPEEQRWVEAATEILPKEFEPNITPWHDGERLHFEWTNLGGQTMSVSYILMEKIDFEGRALWRASARYRLGGDRVVFTEFDPETFDTVYSEYLGMGGEIRAWYSDDATDVSVEYSQNDAKKEFNFEGTVYDNEQAWELMRQLPVEVGYSANMMLFVPISGAHISVRFNVVEILELDTILGQVECYKVTIDIPGSKQAMYFTTDDRRINTRVEVGGVVASLTKVDTMQKGAVVEYSDEEHGFSVFHPDELVALRRPDRPRSTAIRVNFLSPNLTGNYRLYADANEKLPEAARHDVDAFTDFQIEEESARLSGAYSFKEFIREDFAINGLPAKAYSMHGSSGEDGPEMMRYTYIVQSERMYYIFHAFLRVDEIEKELPRFEKTVMSFRE